MLKLIVFIQCDECNMPFQNSRVSDCTLDALNFNANVLTAALYEDIFWTTDSQKKYHYCQWCSNLLEGMKEQYEH